MVLSILVAIFASGLALAVASNPKREKPAYLASGIVMGLAIAGMHYIGMASMKMDAHIEWNYFLVVLSVLIAVIASVGAIYLAFNLRGETDRRSQIGRILGALGMGLAIAGMHYTGMYAANFIHASLPVSAGDPQGVVASSNLTFLVTGTTSFLLAIALVGSIFDQVPRKRSRQAQEIERMLQRERTAVCELQKERELRDRFVSTLTHDLRTPITAAQLSAEITKRVIDNPEEVLQLNEKILECLTRIDDMIRDLLDAHRISAHQTLPLNIKQTDLPALIKKTVDDLKTIHGDRFQLSLPNSLLGSCDEKYLTRVIENLCSNAVKYGCTRSPILVSLNSDEDKVYLSVKNEGEPLTESELSQLFQIFHRGQVAAQNKTQGWGIGLTLVKGVVEAHGGTISVFSSPSTGTIFTATLPRMAQV